MNILGPTLLGIGVVAIVVSLSVLIRSAKQGLVPIRGIRLIGGAVALLVAYFASANLPFFAYALGGGIAFAALYQFSTAGRTSAVLLVGALVAAEWILFGLYLRAWRLWAQTVVAPIGCDLVLIYPVLAVGTALAFGVLTLKESADRSRLAA